MQKFTASPARPASNLLTCGAETGLGTQEDGGLECNGAVTASKKFILLVSYAAASARSSIFTSLRSGWEGALSQWDSEFQAQGKLLGAARSSNARSWTRERDSQG